MSEILADLALASWRSAGRLASPFVSLFLAARERAGKRPPSTFAPCRARKAHPA